MDNLIKTQPRQSGVRNKKSCRDEERERTVVIPLVVRVVEVRIDPLTVVVPVRVEHVRVAVRIVRNAVHATAH